MSAQRRKDGPWRWWQLALAAAIVALLAYETLPAIDLAISGFFYRPGTGFWLGTLPPLQWVYLYTKWWTMLIALLLLAALARTALGGGALCGATGNRIALALFALVLGPGLLAHNGLKDHWGRPRPNAVAEFGGAGHYVAPWQYSEQCARNCSFVSGHAAAGTLLMGGALLWPRRRRAWLCAGAMGGALIGAVRIVQGAHFFSDVLGSILLTALVVLAAERLALRLGWIAPPVD